MNHPENRFLELDGRQIPLVFTHTLVLGSGAASLAAAVRLKRAGVDDLCIVTDNMKGGTSRNTGSDKQTYYKLSDSTKEPDSPYKMANALFKGGAVHGDIALVESLGSENGFYNLVSMGVPFPFNEWGGYTGYKTDHDPQCRGTSLGPYTSKVMVEVLERETELLKIPVYDHHDCIRLIRSGDRVAGAVVLDKKELDSSCFGMKIFLCENMIFGLGGPGGMYASSVYPPAHTGGIGLALEIGAEAVNLTESQFGIGSVKFRWNLSGSYQQVIPSYYSRDPVTGQSYPFLNDYFPSMKSLSRAIFLKGYQWPFDPEKIRNEGSSLIDLLIYREIEILGREVYMDFRGNPEGNSRLGTFSRDCLSDEASEYWDNSGLTGLTPIERLRQLNPQAIRLYHDHGINLESEPLQIAVCAQHNNGGLAGDAWWESTNISRLFPVGEVNGSHGVYRPGGTALNSGQVGAFRASQKIAGAYSAYSLDIEEARTEAAAAAREMITLMETVASGMDDGNGRHYQQELQSRMSRFGAVVRDPSKIEEACRDAKDQYLRFDSLRTVRTKLPHLMKQRHLALAHWFYLAAAGDYMRRGGGSRGSYLVMSDRGGRLHDMLDWKVREDSPALRSEMQVLRKSEKSSEPVMKWIPCRSIPESEFWFEKIWSRYLDRSVFD